jgi:exoribonuclease-2
MVFRLSEAPSAAAYVTFEINGELRLGVALASSSSSSSGGKRPLSVVIDEDGKEINLPSNRLYYLPKSSKPLMQDKVVLVNELKALREKILEEENLLQNIWELIHTEPKEYSISELTELYFGRDSLKDHLTLRFQLLSDKTYFRREANNFIPRSPEAKEAAITELAANAQKIARAESLLNFLLAKINGDEALPPLDVKRELRLLFKVAAGGDFTSAKDEGLSNILLEYLVKELKVRKIVDIPSNQPHNEAAFQILLTASLIKEDQNLFFLRENFREEFSEEALLAADNLKEEVSMPQEEAIPVFTIDDESATDLDDALHFTEIGDGKYELGVHITCVARFLKSGTVLDKVGRLRGSSVYCTDVKAHLLPSILSEEIFSLLPDAPRLSLSGTFILDPNGVLLEEPRFALKVIKSVKRYSYDEVDVNFSTDSTLKALVNLGEKLEEKRVANGAVIQSNHEIVAVLREGEVVLEENRDDTPARRLIREAMILYNSEIAKFGASAKLPLPYRSQEAPDDLGPMFLTPEAGAAYNYELRGRFKRSKIGVHPSLHWSLGVDAYVQATSPIRRYLDLIAQRQVLNFLEGSPLYTEDDLEEIINQSEGALGKVRNISRDSRRYWMLRYLEKLKDKDEVVSGTVVRSDNRGQLVELSAPTMVTPVKIPHRGDFNSLLGKEVTLKIVAVNARREFIKVEALP